MKPWSEMTPRERDALVASKVMNIHKHKFDPDLNDSFCTVCRGHESREQHNFESILYYTTSIAAAWEVVEKLSPGGVFEISREKDGHYNAGLYREVYVDPLGLGKADTAPEAICLAALRACSVHL